MRIVTRRVAVSLGSALLAASLMLGTAACSDDGDEPDIDAPEIETETETEIPGVDAPEIEVDE